MRYRCIELGSSGGYALVPVDPPLLVGEVEIVDVGERRLTPDDVALADLLRRQSVTLTE